MRLIIYMLQTSNISAQTKNGAISLATSSSPVLDFFFKAIRGSSEESTAKLLLDAWEVDPLLTLRAVFHLRDCRGGKGEKEQFYICMRALIGVGHDNDIKFNLSLIPEYGSYKDLFIICADNILEETMLDYYSSMLKNDIDQLNKLSNLTVGGWLAHDISLAAKWAPTEGKQLDRKYGYVKKLTKCLKNVNIPTTCTVKTSSDYRKNIIAPLRKHLAIVERNVCAGEWSTINYSHVPSLAMQQHKKVFKKHDEARFSEYLADVAKGKSKINAGVLHPHQLVQAYLGSGTDLCSVNELQWKAIVEKTKLSFDTKDMKPLALVDVSGSMQSGLGGKVTPMSVAIALGILLSELAPTPFTGTMLTFESQPSLIKTKITDTLFARVKQVSRAPWGGSTDIQRAFDLILTTATMLNVAPENMPTHLFIFSDMQFNQASPANASTNFETIEQKYIDAGYVRPNIIFWNLSGDSVDFPVDARCPKTTLVSGFSQSIMSAIMAGDTPNAMAVMMSILDSERYQQIKLCPK